MIKLMIASDIHGSAYYCKKMLEAFDREQADRLLLLGDILYHGPRNDLPKEYAPKEVIKMLNERKTGSSASAETVIPKWTRWFWNSRSSRITR